MAKNPVISFVGSDKNAFSQATYNHAMLYIPKGTWNIAVYDGDWSMFYNIREMEISASELSNTQAYTLMNAKSFEYMIYDDVNNEVKSIGKHYDIDESNANSSWQIVNIEGRNALYNVGAKKFANVRDNGEIYLTSTPIPLSMIDGNNGITLNGVGNIQWNFVLNDKISVNKDLTDIEETADDCSSTKGYYDVQGRKIARMQRGINIVRYSNGTTKRVMVK